MCYSRRTTSDESWNMQKKSQVDDPMVAFLVKENWVKCIANLHVLYAVTERVYKSQAFRSLRRSLGYHCIEISHYLMNNNPQKNCVKLISKNSLIKIGYAVSKKRFVLILHYLTFHHIYQWQLSKIFIYRKRRTTSSWKIPCNDHSCIVCVSSVGTFFRRSFFFTLCQQEHFSTYNPYGQPSWVFRLTSITQTFWNATGKWSYTYS